jgi:hypothetical protein
VCEHQAKNKSEQSLRTAQICVQSLAHYHTHTNVVSDGVGCVLSVSVVVQRPVMMRVGFSSYHISTLLWALHVKSEHQSPRPCWKQPNSLLSRVAACAKRCRPHRNTRRSHLTIPRCKGHHSHQKLEKRHVDRAGESERARRRHPTRLGSSCRSTPSTPCRPAPQQER